MGTALFVAWASVCAGDATTTAYILNTGGREAWLPTQHAGAAAAIAGGTCLVGIPAIHNLSKTHPKAAKVIGWSIVAVRGSIVASNLQQIRRH